MSGLRIDVADLLAHPGSRREIVLDEALEGMGSATVAMHGPLHFALSLERISEGIVVRGTIAGEWSAVCSRCLEDLTDEVSVHVDELFENEPLEGETYPLEGHLLDLEQLARDAVLLELPLAPHCSDDCEPVLTDEQLDEPPVDPRWAALADIELAPPGRQA